jgi:Transposase DDE domain
MAREIARSWEGRTSRRLRKKIEMLFAHLKRILKLDRLRLPGPNGAHDEFILAATAQNLRKSQADTAAHRGGRIETRKPGARPITMNYCRPFSTESALSRLSE